MREFPTGGIVVGSTENRNVTTTAPYVNIIPLVGCSVVVLVVEELLLSLCTGVEVAFCALFA